MNKLAVIFIGVFFMGCAGMSTQISVSNDNVLTCTMPSLKVKVADNFTYKPERTVLTKYVTKVLFWLENVMLSFGMLF